MELVLPSIEYKDSYIAAVKEFQADTSTVPRSLMYRKLSIAELDADFGTFVEKKNAQARGENLPEGWVPSTEFWLVESGELIGSVNVRHRLTSHLEVTGGHIGYDIRPSQRGKGYGNEILRLALPKARELGIKRVLVLCLATNIASRKVIEKNGGVYTDTVTDPETGGDHLRFWIENQ